MLTVNNVSWKSDSSSSLDSFFSLNNSISSHLQDENSSQIVSSQNDSEILQDVNSSQILSSRNDCSQND